MVAKSTSLSSFFCTEGARQRATGFDFCLPRFEASLVEPAPLSGLPHTNFGYPSSTFAERDARSAFHVMHTVASAVGDDDIRFTAPRDFMKPAAGERTAFVFGSRSNEAVNWLLDSKKGPHFIKFAFGDSWEIIGEGGRKFSIPDPSKLDRPTYTSMTDYGVVARLSHTRRKGAVFLIAGLGGRATEGCGLYLAREWTNLHRRFGQRDFAVVLEFPPPVEAHQHTEVACYA
jgi:hypothetical protein